MSDEVNHWAKRRGELHALWMSPLSAAEIGKKLGVGKNAIIGAINRARVDEGEDRWPKRISHKQAAMTRGRAKRRAEAAAGVVCAPRTVFGVKVGHKPKPAPRPRQPRRARTDLQPTMLYLDARVGIHCEFIDEDPAAKPITEVRCCGRYVMLGYSWCADHREIVFGERAAA